MLQNVNNIISPILAPILDDSMQLITRFHHVHIKYCFRQANQCADGLAGMSCRMSADFSSYDNSPVDILDIFEEDLNEMYFNRLCT